MDWDLKYHINITLLIWVFFLAYELLSCTVRPHFWNDYGLAVVFRDLIPLGLGGYSLMFSIRMIWAVIIRKTDPVSGLACGIGSAVVAAITWYLFVVSSMSV